MTKRELKELQEVRRSAFPMRAEEVVVIRTSLQQSLDRIQGPEGWDEPIEAKQERWRANLQRQLEEERYGL